MKRETYPNFDFIRLLAASSVIFSHSFLIGDGSETREPFVQLLGPNNILGIYAVFCFFIMSGFLVTQSLLTAPSVPNYLWRRFFRIYPGLLVCLCLSAFLLGAAFSQAGPIKFLSGPASIKYVLGNLVRPGHTPSIPSVIFYPESSGWLGTMINGSLWTIFHEVICYLLLAAFSVLGALRAWSMGLIAILMTVANVAAFDPHSETISGFLLLAPGFFAGAAFSLAGIQMTRIPRVTLAATAGSVLLMVIAAQRGMLSDIFPLAGAVPLLLFAKSASIRLPRIDRLGDISYGAYLYGWPAEQVVRSTVGPEAGWSVVFALALPLAGLLGYASWWLVELPALRCKDRFLRRLRSTPPSACQD
jgi:peptidoglycan/LPS O-acetylase OafA/YrhL